MATRLFAWKLATRSLPTLDRQNRHNPNLYPHSSCPNCPDTPESHTHVFVECPQYAELRRETSDSVLRTYRALLPSGPDLPLWMDPPLHSSVPHWDHDAVAAGLIPDTFRLLLRDNGIPDDLATRTAERINDTIIAGHRHIWRARCSIISRRGLTYAALLTLSHNN